MVLRFTAEDVGRVRLARTIGPLAEAVQAMGAMLRPQPLGPARVARRRQSSAELMIAHYLRPLPRIGVDVVTLGAMSHDRHDAAEALHTCSSDWLGHELRMFPRPAAQDLPAWLADAQADGADGHHRLVEEVDTWFERHLASQWAGVRDTLDAEYDRLARTLSAGGVDALMAGLDHGIRWENLALHIPDAAQWSAGPLEIALDGRGLVIVPSRFAAVPEPYFPIDATRPAVLVVPICPQSALADAPRSEAAAGAVLGKTRARVLATLAAGSFSTSELAARAGISASSASEHATALRRAGLIDSRREGREVRHRATNAGRALLGWPVIHGRSPRPFGHDRKVTTTAIPAGEAGARATNPADPGGAPHGRM